MNEQVWKRVRQILATVFHTKLWTDRNDAVYKAAVNDLSGTTQSFWTSSVCQLFAKKYRLAKTLLSILEALHATQMLTQRSKRRSHRGL